MKRLDTENPIKPLLRRARARAQKKGFDYNLCEYDLFPLPTHCPILGFELKANGGSQDPYAYSLDRVDNSKGYIVGNIAVMSYQANRLKNNGTSLELRAIADWMDQQALGWD